MAGIAPDSDGLVDGEQVGRPANTLADFDTALEPGHLVLPGTPT